ncbi:MAG: DUF1461 domain-containing protein [Candidatus Limnocylindrales bacterium]
MSWLLPFATALVIIVAGVLVLTTPVWMHPALEVAGASVPGLTRDENLGVSDQTVNELIFGPGSFLISMRRQPCDATSGCPAVPNVYTADEAAHLRDARALLWLGIALAAASLVFVIVALVHRRKDARRWRAVARGGASVAVGAVVVGVVGYFAFDTLFTLFHEVFFPGGNWEFPADSNMIRLYPYAFWELTAAALGALCVIGGAAVWFVARRRARAAA